MSFVIGQQFETRRPAQSTHVGQSFVLSGTQLQQAARAHRSVLQARLFAAVVRRIGAAVREAYVAWQQHSRARAVYSTLSKLDARTLHDLGFERSEIASVAAELSGTADQTRTRVVHATRELA